MPQSKGSLLVIGGASTIGKAIILLFASKGIPVAFTSRKDATDVAKTLQDEAEKLSKSSTSVVAVIADPTKQEDMKYAVEEAVKVGNGHLLYAINVAGLIQSGGNLKPLWDLDMKDISDMINVNITAIVIANREQMKQMSKQTIDVEKDGETPFAIINVASVYGQRGMAFNSMYTTTKHAVIGLTKSLGLEAYRYGVRVNSVSPGYHITEEMQEAPKDWMDMHLSPTGKGGDFQALAKTFYHVAVEAIYTAGTDFSIDGGFLARGPGLELDDYLEKCGVPYKSKN